MATKLRAAVGTKVTAKTLVQKGAQKERANAPTFEEVFVRNDVVSLCLLVNRRARTMRVIDFRAGASPAKKVFVQSIARREQMDKIIVLVERDECATWSRLGFSREGNIAGFYKRSDAFIMGCVVPAADAPAPRERRPSVTPRIGESGVFSIGGFWLDQEPDDDDDEELPSPVASAQAEKTMVQARKLAKEITLGAGPLKLTPLSEADAHKRIDKATKEGRALTGFEAFGRDVTRDDLVVSQRGHEVVIGAEIQRCYGNAFLEVLSSPRDDKERNFLAAAIGAVCDRLQENQSVCAFALAPVDDVRLATAFVAAGFRRTGLLRQHLRVGDHRVDALLFCRKLAVTGDEN
ncbi:MAG: hypothetical protein IPJ34_01980 [Myxococcales bacterium]|nr:hypothetical protein [Myxococcales bacterium]